MLNTILLILYILVAISLVISVLLHGAKPSKTLAWLLAIFTIPVGGILLYLLVGRNRRKNKLLKLKKAKFLNPARSNVPEETYMDGKYQKLMKLAFRSSQMKPTLGNTTEVLKDGKSTFEAIFKALNEARAQIHIQYYIFEEGELAQRLLEVFKTKIEQGVKIRMIYDGIGSFSLSRAYRKQLLALGVEVYPFLPFKFGRFLSSVNYRNHRKIIVVDGQLAFTGGINISDKYLKGDPTLGNWHDMHISLQGPAAANLDAVFAMDWYLVSQQYLEPLTLQTAMHTKGGPLGTMVQIVSGGPDDDFPSLEQAYFSIINLATKYLYIINPYIIPSQPILQALQTAALGGLDVRLMVSENADNRIVSWCVRSYFEPLLKSGVKIYLFPDGFLHSKLMISDDAISSIGTANLDGRSFEQNYEVNALVYDASFTLSLKQDFLRDCNVSRILSYAEHTQRPWSEKLKEGFGKIFSPIL
ncbi:MAG: cardiolipin synthase [Flavobacteriaceae bacterium]